MTYTPKTLNWPQPVWPLQMGQPLHELKFSQQQCKCNKRQPGQLPVQPPSERQMQ